MCADCQQHSKENAERHNYSANKSCLKGSWGQCVMMTFAREVTLSLRKKWDGFNVGRLDIPGWCLRRKGMSQGEWGKVWVLGDWSEWGVSECVYMRVQMNVLYVCVWGGQGVYVGGVGWRLRIWASLMMGFEPHHSQRGNSGCVQFNSVAQLCLTLCDPMNRSTPGLPVHYQLPEFIQTHVHWVSDAIQPFHPLSSPSPPTLNSSQCQGLSRWVSSSHQVAEVLEFQLQHQSFQWTPRTDLL